MLSQCHHQRSNSKRSKAFKIKQIDIEWRNFYRLFFLPNLSSLTISIIYNSISYTYLYFHYLVVPSSYARGQNPDSLALALEYVRTYVRTHPLVRADTSLDQNKTVLPVSPCLCLKAFMEAAPPAEGLGIRARNAVGNKPLSGRLQRGKGFANQKFFCT